MKEKKPIIINFSTAICIVIIVLLLIAFAIFIFYLNYNYTSTKLNSQKSSLESSKTNSEENIITNNYNTVTTDIQNSEYNYGDPLPYEGRAELRDGYLYYSRSINEELRKIEGVSNIKLLYMFNIGTGINKTPFVVTNDGTVYRLTGNEKLVKYEGLSNYKVDKIISYEGEMSAKFTLLLLDGTTKIVELNHE